ncbi:Transmembrane protein 243 [Trichoplax sp. H2]|nr:Transmembrane protein 243 [Trichoplax sp. H2]|eukprot:RDD46003.1 Transmembrane protein 243 [Trichoplax sp. H2]
MDFDSKPLFGETPPKYKAVHYGTSLFTTAAVLFTMVCVFAINWPPKGINIVFLAAIVFQSISQIVMIRWYREGDVDPKFLKLIYYNTFVLLLFCFSCNLYAFNVKF